MNIEGNYTLNMPIESVWHLINDPSVLRDCIPGCEELTETSAGHFEAVVRLKVGPVKAKFLGDVQMVDAVPPNRFRLTGVGKGGVAGMATGHADVELVATDSGTELSYHADAKVAGKLAQLGSRLIESTARKLANQFFENFERLASEQHEMAPKIEV